MYNTATRTAELIYTATGEVTGEVWRLPNDTLRVFLDGDPDGMTPDQCRAYMITAGQCWAAAMQASERAA